MLEVIRFLVIAFALFHISSGEPVLVNIEHITTVRPSLNHEGGRTVLNFVSGNHQAVRESFQEVRKIITP